MNEEDANLQSLFANLNQVSRDAIIRERAGGGTGGGSEIVEGSMDPNSLMIGNPYIAKNVVGFNQGGAYGGRSPWQYLYDTMGLDLTGEFRAQAARDRQAAANQAFYQNIQDTGKMKPSIYDQLKLQGEEFMAQKQAKDAAFVEHIKSGQGWDDLKSNYLAAEGMKFGSSGVPTMSNPYLDKVNQLVGLQQMVNVGKGMMRNALMEEAVTDSLIATPIAKHGMKRKYVNGGVYNEGGVAEDEEVVSKDTRLLDHLDELRSKSAIFGQITPPRQSLGERARPLYEMWEKVRAGEIPVSTMYNLTNYRPPVERNPFNPFGSTILGNTMQLPYWQELIDRRRQKAQDILEQNYFNEMLLEQNRDVEFKKEGTPIANKGMKMKKRYTQGGRF